MPAIERVQLHLVLDHPRDRRIQALERFQPGAFAATITAMRVSVIDGPPSWTSHVHVLASDLLPVPAAVDPAEVETLVVNGITAWQMLHDVARVRSGQTIVVLGANGGVGSILVQLARHAGITVIGTASPAHHDLVRGLGAAPVDYRDPDLYGKIRELAPDGVDGVFDHVGGEALVQSWQLLRKGGALVSYGTAATKDAAGSSRLPVLTLFARLTLWNSLPNSKSAHFYNFWAGRRRSSFGKQKREAFARVLELLAAGHLTPQIAARMPLSDAAAALKLAESRTIAGKVILTPDA